MFKNTMTRIAIPTILLITMVGCSIDQVVDGSDDTIKEEQTSTFDKKLIIPQTNLQEGDHGEHVKNLQQSLTTIGYQLDITSRFDQTTKDALKDLQSQSTQMAASGKYDEATKQGLEKIQYGTLKITPSKGFNRDNISTSTTKVLQVKDFDSLTVLTNKFHALPIDYEPKDLTAPNVPFPFTEDLPKRYIRKVAATALEELFKEADQAGFQLYGQSGYRSYERQVEVFAGHSKRLGEKDARKVSAVPGQSEHQTGLAMDITAASVNFDLTKDFGKTKEGQWVAKNAHKFGFIIRYPEGKERITGYDYEPWHLRYIGKDIATFIYENDITLEEYLGAVE